MKQHGELKDPADDPMVTLPNPRRPEHGLTQIGYQLFSDCGLTMLSWGEISLEQHTQLLVERTPAFRSTVVAPSGAGTLEGRDDVLWLGFDGPQGSVIACFGFQHTDNDFFFDNVSVPIGESPPGRPMSTSVPSGSFAECNIST